MEEGLKQVITNSPMMVGLILTIYVLLRDLDHERKARAEDCKSWSIERDKLQDKIDQTNNKLVDVALRCHDEELKSEVLTWTPNQ